MEQEPSSSPQGLKLETVQPVAVKKLDSEAGDSVSSLQLNVKLVPEDKQTLGKWLAETGRNLWRDPWARRLTIFICVALLALGLQRLLFFLPQKSEDIVGQVTCFAQYPKWIAPLDEESLIITLFNDGSTDLTQVKVLLVFKGTLCVHTDAEGSTMLEFEGLAVGERKTRTTHFKLERMAQRCPIEVQAQLISRERGIESIPSPYTIRVISERFPIPHYKTLVQNALGVLIGILGMILGLIGERFSSILGLK